MIIDPSAASFIALLRKRGRYKVHPADNAVLDGIRETANALDNGYVKIFNTCKEWKAEAGGYIWDAKATDDRPVNVNDHLMDATRYFVKTKRIIKKVYTIKREAQYDNLSGFAGIRYR